jgi:hypothetical protein
MRSRFRYLPLLAAIALAAGGGLLLRPLVELEEQEEERRPDEPLEAIRWMQMAQRDEAGNIAPNGLMIAKGQMDAMRAQQRRDREAAGGIHSIAGINQAGWTWIGPGNIGGRTRTISINPLNTQDILAAGVAGGIWRTTNAGGTWSVINDFMANLAVSTIVRRPGAPATILAGTGEGFFNADSIRGAGIFRSTDNGASWTQLPSTTTASFQYVNRLAFADDGSVLIAATRSGLFRSTDVGDTWTQVLAVSEMTDVKFLWGSATQAVASGFVKRAYYTTNGGVNWIAATLPATPAPGTFNRIELGTSVSAACNVYASYAAGGTSSSPPAEMWRSTDCGVTYTLVSVSGHLGAQGWYDNAIWVDPTNVNHVIVGGVSRFRSTDGATWAGMGGSVHSDHHAFVSDPGYNGTSNRRVYFGNDGGVYRLEDSQGTSFTRLNNNYGVTQFYGGAGQNGTGKIFGGTQDNGTLVYTPAGGPQGWTTMAGGDGGYATADQTNNNYLYGEFQWLGVHRSSNGGTSSASITGCGGAAPLSDSCNQTTNFISPILLDPNNPTRLLAGGRSLWLNSDARASSLWAAIKNPTPGNSNISAITVANGNSNLIWVGHNSGDLFKTTNGLDGAPAWIKMDDNGPVPGRTATSIALDPANADVVYASFGGFNSGNVWKSIDGGLSWASASGSGGGTLPSVPVRSVVAHPFVPGWIYAGTDIGVFASENGGATWQIPHDGPANVAVFQVFFLNTTLVAVTHGRGMYTADVSVQPPAITQHPTHQTVGIGATATFTAAASGTPAPGWQWQRWNGAAWVNLSNGPVYSGATSAALGVANPDASLSGSQFRAVATNPGGSAASNAAQLTVYGSGVSLLQNGDFSDGSTGWQFWEAPDIVWNIVGGEMQFHRQQPTTTSSGQAVVFQHTGVSMGAGVPLTAQFDIGNSSSARKRLSVLMLDSNFTDLHVCTFFLEPNAPMRTYRMRTHSTQAWANASIYFYAASGGSNGGNYRLDNVSMAYDPAASTTRTDCVDPTAPPVLGGASSSNLLGNGDFGAGALPPWSVFGNITWQLAGGVFEFHRPTATPPAAVLFQGVGPMPTQQVLTATIQLGNSSAQRRRVTVLLNDSDFSDLVACTFWLPAGAPLDTYTLKTFTTKAWGNAMISVYSATSGVLPWVRVDNATLQTTPSSVVIGTECIEPVPPSPNGLLARTRR